jgi:ribosomal protein L16 Arg81 hydroxylase
MSGPESDSPREERRRLVDATGDELRALLSPLPPADFVRDYWARRPLFVKGFSDKYKGFFDAEAFAAALSGSSPVPPDFLRASFDTKVPEPGSQPTRIQSPGPLFHAHPDQASALFDGGATLCVTQVELRAPRLAAFVGAIKSQLGYPGRVSFSAYLSPPGSGFHWHFDMRVASSLQIEGTKRWRFSNRVAVDWPRDNGVLRADGSGSYKDGGTGLEPWERLAPFDEKDTTEVLLEPGDLLVLPAGTWHDACGVTGASLALNLSFTPVSYGVLLKELLDSMLGSDPAWRGPAPLPPMSSSASGPFGAVDAEPLRVVATELARAADALRSVTADSSAMMNLWTSFVLAGPSAGTGNVAPTPPPLTEDDTLRVRGGVYARSADGGAKLLVSVGALRLELTGRTMRFVGRALAAREFAARECAAWGEGGTPLARNDVLGMLSRMVEDGILEQVRVNSRA